MRLVEERRGAERRLHSAAGEAQQAFDDGRVFVERYVRRARHVEVQVLADGHGGVIHLGHRDCTLQRRYQKLIEEAPGRRPARRRSSAQILGAASALIGALDYTGAATCEFLVDPERGTLRLPRDQRAPAGRAPGDRDGHRHRHRARAAAHRRRHAAVGRAGRRPDPRPRDRGAHQRGAPRARLPALARAHSTAGRRRWAATCASTPPASPGWTVAPYYDSLLAKVIARGRRSRRRRCARIARRCATCASRASTTTAGFALDVLEHPDVVPGTSTPRGSRRSSCPAGPQGGGGLMARIEFIDQSLRDGQQSLWGMRMRAGHILPVADAIDTRRLPRRRPHRQLDLRGAGALPPGGSVGGLDAIRAAFAADSTLRAGTRDNGVVGMGITPDSIIELWVADPGQARHRQPLDLRLPAQRRQDARRSRRSPATPASAPSPQVNFSESPVHTDEYYASIMAGMAAGDVAGHDHPRRRGRRARPRAGAALDPPDAGARARRAAGDALPRQDRDRQRSTTCIGVEEGVTILHTADQLAGQRAVDAVDRGRGRQHAPPRPRGHARRQPARRGLRALRRARRSSEGHPPRRAGRVLAWRRSSSSSRAA